MRVKIKAEATMIARLRYFSPNGDPWVDLSMVPVILAAETQADCVRALHTLKEMPGTSVPLRRLGKIVLVDTGVLLPFLIIPQGFAQAIVMAASPDLYKTVLILNNGNRGKTQWMLSSIREAIGTWTLPPGMDAPDRKDYRQIIARALCCDAEEFMSDPMTARKWGRAADAVLKSLGIVDEISRAAQRRDR